MNRWLALIAIFCANLCFAVPVETVFTYQGDLKQAGMPAEGLYDFQFEMYDADAGGTLVGGPVILDDIGVADGVFTVHLDFGIGPFGGDQMWLEIAVREGDSGGGYTGLLPRQMITAVPYAMHAEFVAMNAIGAAEIDPNQVQLRVSGSCGGDTFMRLIEPDGSVICNQDQMGPWMASGPNIFYDTGRVGIGTSNPITGLDIESPAGYGSAIALNNTGGGLEWRITSWTDGTLRLVKSSGTVFSAMVIEPVDGYIGIGTSTPDMPLSVHTDSGISYIRVSDNTTGPASGLRLGLSGSGNAYIINDEPNKALSLGTDGTSHVRITDTGRVGINELTPDMLLHIRQDVSNKGIRIQHNSTTDYWENGIGVTTKNYKFYYNNLFRADISSVDGSYTQSSDRRLKRNITSLDSVLARVRKLTPSSYQLVDSADDSAKSIGFIAQDVRPLFPELVRMVDDGDSMGLVYDGFAVISIQAIKEMAERMDQMQRQLDDLERQLKVRR